MLAGPEKAKESQRHAEGFWLEPEKARGAGWSQRKPEVLAGRAGTSKSSINSHQIRKLGHSPPLLHAQS
ncbi:hypothetical protein A2U01_0091833, partial [Trifolium medium]|nr:hypothetical protein [Trifolium medium]